MKRKRIKAILAVFMCAALLFMSMGCQSQDDTGMFTPGTYEGVGQGIHGDIKVEVEVDSEKILNITVVEHSETEGVSDPAFARIPSAIIDGQTLAVDIVSGATYSSNGILEAVTAALTAAGGDIDALMEDKGGDVVKETVQLTTDVVIIGAGGAGLAAAVSAHENGAEVIVLEKMSTAGGNTIISGASYNAVDPSRQEPQGIEDSIELHFQQTYEGGDELGNPEMIQILVEQAYPTIQWLEAMGMQFNDHIHTVLGGLWPRAHSPVKPLGTGFIETFMNYIDGTNGEVEVMLETKATELIMDGNKAVGVKAEGTDAIYEITATNGVVIAAGGFGASVELRNQYNVHWGDLTNIPTTNHPGATGDGIVMAEAVGADLVGMEWIQLLPMGDPQTGSLLGNIEQGVENRIFVNKDGNRFVDEGERRDVMTQALFEQEDNFMWVVLDKHSYPTEDIKNHFNESIEDMVAQGRAFKGETLEELAAQIGVDADNLIKAVEEFNAGVDAGVDSFGRTLFEDKIDTPPYYAGARVPTVHHTMGGILINTEAQVLDTDGNIIENLYAAGEVTGGIHGTNRLGGNALADINVFGKIAGANAALSK